jgi:hypothetical protein
MTVFLVWEGQTKRCGGAFYNPTHRKVRDGWGTRAIGCAVTCHMRQITEVLIFGPPTLAVITWILTRAWTRATQRQELSAAFRKWQQYDFWIILLNMEIVMFVTAMVEHKL